MRIRLLETKLPATGETIHNINELVGRDHIVAQFDVEGQERGQKPEIVLWGDRAWKFSYSQHGTDGILAHYYRQTPMIELSDSQLIIG